MIEITNKYSVYFGRNITSEYFIFTGIVALWNADTQSCSRAVMQVLAVMHSPSLSVSQSPPPENSLRIFQLQKGCIPAMLI